MNHIISVADEVVTDSPSFFDIISFIAMYMCVLNWYPTEEMKGMILSGMRASWALWLGGRLMMASRPTTPTARARATAADSHRHDGIAMIDDVK